MLRTCGLILCLVAGTLQLQIVNLVVPRSIEVGKDAELYCKYTIDAGDRVRTYVKWWFTPLYGAEDIKSPMHLYQRFEHEDPDILRSNINVTDDGDGIIVRNMQYSDSGIYECEVSGSEEIRRNEQLTVFSSGTGPQLNFSRVADGPDNDTDDDVMLECMANDVTPQPDLVISVDGVNVNNLTTYVTSPTPGIYNVVVNVTVSKEFVEGKEISCELFYNDPNIYHPQYVDAMVYSPSGDALSTTEPVEDTTETQATSNPLQTQRAADNRNQGAWMLIIAVSTFVHLCTML